MAVASYFYKMSVPERRSEFVFGTAAEVMQVMEQLSSKVALLRPSSKEQSISAPQSDEMLAAIKAGQSEKPSERV
jgi:hypothetical protein